MDEARKPEYIGPNKDVIEITKEILAQNRIILEAIKNPIIYAPVGESPKNLQPSPRFP